MANVAGIDWASEEHAACVVDESGGPIRRWLASHDEAGITSLCRELVELGVVRVAIERPDGVLVERLLGAGLTVLAIHPNQLKAAGRAWIRVLWRCWHDHVPYDPALHGNLRRLELARG
jgi:Transposase